MSQVAQRCVENQGAQAPSVREVLPPPVSLTRILVISNSLVTAAPAYALVVFSTLFFQVDPTGQLSSLASAMSFIGAVLGGFAGTKALETFPAPRVGMLLALSGLLATAIAYGLGPQYINVLLSCLVVIQLIQVIDVANTMQQIERRIAPAGRVQVHSRHQLAMTLMALASPLVAGVAAKVISIHALVPLSLAYIVAFFHWNKLGRFDQVDTKEHVASHFGFRDLFAHAPLRRLTTFRLLTACAHSATFVAVPLLAARVASADHAGLIQSILLLAVALGFTAGHWNVTRWWLGSKPSFALVWVGCIGSAAAWIAVALTESTALGIVACAVHGIALYCLRMAGVMVGRLVTPPEVFGQAVLIGDTISRFGSAFVGLTASMFLIRFSNWESRMILIGSLALIAASAVLVARKLWRDVPSTTGNL